MNYECMELHCLNMAPYLLRDYKWLFLPLFFSFLLFLGFLIWPLLPTHCTCRGLPFHLITHTNPQTTLGRTPLDEGSARRTDFYLKTDNTHKGYTSMPPAGFEAAISARAWTHGLAWRPWIFNGAFLLANITLYSQSYDESEWLWK